MMRYLVKVRGEPKDAASKMNVEEKLVDIFSEEQFSEFYLTKVNSNGQVPVLGSTVAFSFPLAQTSAISIYIAERHPRLLPEDHAAEIKRLVKKMHELNFFTLSFRGSPKLASGFSDAALRRLEDKTISDEYRKALEYKVTILKRDKVNALEPEKVQAESDKAGAYFETVAALLKPEAGPWLFGQRHPTELDAHLVVMIARLQDVGRHEIIPDALKKYAEAAYATPEWINVMQGRTTMYDGSGKK